MLPTSLKQLPRTLRMSRQATTAAIKFAICNIQFAISNLKAALLSVATSRCGRVVAAGKGERKATPRLAMLYTQRMQIFCHTESRISDSLKAGFLTVRKQAFRQPESRLSDNNGGISRWKNILKTAAMVAMVWAAATGMASAQTQVTHALQQATNAGNRVNNCAAATVGTVTVNWRANNANNANAVQYYQVMIVQGNERKGV